MPVEQHPIPQDVTGYRFRLVGDMTLKQFAELAGGLVLALVFWSSPLPFFFKYPLAALAAVLGAGMAFVPINGRPFEQWIIAFIRSIYSPTVFIWNKSTIDDVTTPPLQSTPPGPKLPTPTPPHPDSQPAPKHPVPFTPTTPNTLVGMTLTSDGKILPDVLIEISKDNLTVRATKSNKLGQFMFARPLENGTYQIITEKAGLTFQTYALKLTGQIVPPLRLQAQT